MIRFIGCVKPLVKVMAALEIGSVVVKVSGNEAERKAVITDLIDGNCVYIVGSKEVWGKV